MSCLLLFTMSITIYGNWNKVLILIATFAISVTKLTRIYDLEKIYKCCVLVNVIFPMIQTVIYIHFLQDK